MSEGKANTPSDPPAKDQLVRHWWQGISREGWALTVITIMIFFVVILTLIVTGLRIEQIRDQNAFDQALISQVRPAIESTAIAPDAALNERAEAILAAAEAALAEAQQLTASAEDAQNTVDLLLSFLEGATVLVGIALGAAAYFGFRNFREIHDDAIRVQTDLENTQSGLSNTKSELESGLKDLRAFRTGIENAQEIFSQLVLAHQEMRLGNHKEAYDAAKRILKLDPNNVQALYLSGWLENQYIEGERDNALLHLEKAVELSPDWPSARAALGVIQRRRAVQATGKEKNDLIEKALYNLHRALLDNSRLLDPNLESFNGPLAAIHRERGDFYTEQNDPQKAQEHYMKAQDLYAAACGVTPGSSYPAGNLAALYLRDHKVNGASRSRAVKKFIETLRLANAEIAQSPGDYFIMMDIAMSTIILSGHDSAKYNLDEGCDRFRDALATSPTIELLRTTERGLKNLSNYCPNDWQDVKTRIDELLGDVRKLIDPNGPSNNCDSNDTQAEDSTPGSGQ